MSAARARSVDARAERLERVASVAERLAVLMAGGATADAAWRHALRPDDRVEAPCRAARPPRREADALPTVRALAASEHAEWRALACTWRVAESTGAPIADALGDLADALRDVAGGIREIGTALAAPEATARVVVLLPLAGIALALLVDAVAVLAFFVSPGGLACVALAAGLVLASRAWMARLVAGADPGDGMPGLDCELTALGMRGGSAGQRVVEIVERALAAHGLDAGAPDESDASDGGARGSRRPQVGARARSRRGRAGARSSSPDARRSTGRATAVDRPTRRGRAEEVLEFAAAAGVPAAGLLRSEARLVRRRARARAARTTAVLGVQLMLPLGACILPAFFLVGVVPLVAAILRSTLGAVP